MHKLTLFSVIAIFAFSAFAYSQDAEVERKVNAQFGLFDSARTTLIDKVGCSGNDLSREQWEQMLRPAPKDALSPADIKALKAKQASDIQAARDEAISRSNAAGIDVSEIKKLHLAAKFCSAMPKGAMLHVHPLGTMKASTAERLLTQRNPVINRDSILAAVTPDSKRFNMCELNAVRSLPQGKTFNALTPEQKKIVVGLFELPDEKQDFTEFQAKFSYLNNFLRAGANSQAVDSAIMTDFVKGLPSEKVSHVELTNFCQGDSAQIAATSADYAKIAAASSVNVGRICAFNRSDDSGFSLSSAQQVFEMARNQQKTGNRGIVGIDLLGDERKGPTFESGQSVYACLLKERQAGLKLGSTIHSGELGDPRDTRDALIFGVDRIGHGVGLQNDPVALEYARRKKTAVEINLTSNLALGAVGSIEAHPYLNFLRLGLPVSLSTDDEGIMRTSASGECEKAINHSDVTYVELRAMAENSIKTSFMTDAEKQAQLSKLKSDFASFESNWSDHTAAGRANRAPANAQTTAAASLNPCANDGATTSGAPASTVTPRTAK